MSFVESMVTEVTRAVVPDRPLRRTPFPRFSYREAIDRFGSDKPDIRFEMELHDLGAVVQGSGFGVFDSGLAAGGRVFGFAAPGLGGASRSQIDDLTDVGQEGRCQGPRHHGRQLGGRRHLADPQVPGGGAGGADRRPRPARRRATSS